MIDTRTIMNDSSISRDLPSGVVTFLFTDIENSTRLWERFRDSMGEALSLHDQIVADAVRSNGGVVIKSTGDGAHAVFKLAIDAVRAVLAMQLKLQITNWEPVDPILVRTALLTGEAELRDGDYYGSAVNRAARLMSSAWGGQILISAS
ncbi:MAG: adenylate/guanylate cyclase domain-containing protein, partial [Candidatus Promineifilaceae bacterium]